MSKTAVDTHFHVFGAGQAVAGARYVPQYAATLADWMHKAASAGVARGVCVQPSFLGTDNGLLVDVLHAQPDRLRGVAVVDPAVGVDALQALHSSGVRGIRLNVAGASHDIPQWTQAESVWAFMHQWGWHLEVHTDQGGLPRVLRQLPADLPLVVDHMAKPQQARADDASVVALVERARRSAVCVKLSGAYRQGNVDATALAQLWRQLLGADALLWGSDWPCTNHEAHADFTTLLAQARQWIAPDDWEAVMVRNPSRLYWSVAQGAAAVA